MVVSRKSDSTSECLEGLTAVEWASALDQGNNVVAARSQASAFRMVCGPLGSPVGSGHLLAPDWLIILLPACNLDRGIARDLRSRLRRYVTLFVVLNTIMVR